MTRFSNESTARNAAIAKVLRRAAEQDPESWREQTEALWNQQQQDEPSFNDFDDGLQ
jgi:hypothetical protein